MMTESDKFQRLQRVGEAFRPSAPVDAIDLFMGRDAQRTDVMGAVMQVGRHVALYGERGVGKTSLARVLSIVLDGDVGGFKSTMVNCNTESTFEPLWETIFRRLGVTAAELSPEGVRSTLEALDTHALIVIDELDRLEDDPSLSLLADTVKTLSDHAVRATLMLVGVASSIEGLLGEHASIVRNLEQIKMPRMEVNELREILRTGCEHTELSMSSQAEDTIVRLSEGLPHYTHLLGYRAAERVVQDERSTITGEDVKAAISRAVEGHTIENAYVRAVRSSQPGNLYREVLLACAIAQKDSLGYFTSGQVREPLAVVAGRYLEIPAFSKHMKEFVSVERGSVLRREGKPRGYSYRFGDPMVQPYIIMRALDDNLITEQQLIQLQDSATIAAAAAVHHENDPNERGQLF
jgi:Cdc6-like AAA superfamily ATPase